MFAFEDMGKLLITVGVFLILFGLLFTFWGKIPLLGRLPGDFSIQRGGISIFFPLVTSLLLSLVLTIIINIILRLFK